MAHIWSDDVATGFTYDGTWTLQQPLTGTLKLTYHHINDGDIPWIYPGVDDLIVTAAGPARTVTFGTVQDAKDTAAAATAVTMAFDAALAPDGITVTVLLNAATDTFDLTFTGAVVLNWADALSTSTLVWNEVGAGDSPSQVGHVLDLRYVDSRPATLELEIAESTEGVQASRLTDATFFIPTADFQIGDVEFPVNGTTTTLTITWARINAPGIALPMTNQWELQFA